MQTRFWSLGLRNYSIHQHDARSSRRGAVQVRLAVMKAVYTCVEFWHITSTVNELLIQRHD